MAHTKCCWSLVMLFTVFVQTLSNVKVVLSIQSLMMQKGGSLHVCELKMLRDGHFWTLIEIHDLLSSADLWRSNWVTLGLKSVRHRHSLLLGTITFWPSITFEDLTLIDIALSLYDGHRFSMLWQMGTIKHYHHRSQIEGCTGIIGISCFRYGERSPYGLVSHWTGLMSQV